MRKTPSYLKGLAETRARVAGDIRRYEQLFSDISQALEKAKAELAACDTLIRRFDERLNPELIEPIKAWKGHYGKRGALKASIIRILKERAPDSITTTELGLELQLEFRLDFNDWKARRGWLHRSVASCLQALVKKGLVGRLHDPTVFTGEPGRWRWKGEGCESLGDLAALAESSGAGTRSEVVPYEEDEESDADGLPV